MLDITNKEFNMYYLFDSTLKCINSSETEITAGEGQLVKEKTNVFNITYLWWDNTENNFVVKLPEDELDYKARVVRDTLRSNIDMFLLPAATYKNELVLQENKDKLIQDSLLLAQWPSKNGWPDIALPALSDYANSVLTIPVWPPKE
jgi:hypothetical protein